MEINLLDRWRKEVLALSSSMNPNKSISVPKDAILFVESELSGFFGISFFNSEIIQNKLVINNPEGDNWLHQLLVSFHPKAISQLIELSRIIRFYKSSEPELLTDLSNYKDLNNFRQFRNYYFELYTFYLFDRNKIKQEKKNFEGRNELEGVIYIGDKECLFECQKLYYDKIDNLKMNAQIATNICGRMAKKSYPINLAITYTKADLSFSHKVVKEINKIIHQWENMNSLLVLPETRDYNDGAIHLLAEPFAPNRIESMINECKDSNYIVISVKPSKLEEVQRFGHFQTYVNSEVFTTDREIKKYILRRLDSKRKKRANSKYKFRIYFFESEEYPGFDRGLLSPDGLTENVKNEIQKYLDSKKTNDIFVLIQKDSNNNGIPRIRKTVLANQGNEEISSILNKMKCEFN